MCLFSLHVVKEDIRAHRLRDEVGRAEQLLQGQRVGLMEVEQIVPGGQNAQNVVRVLPAYREAGQAGLADGVQNFPLLRVGGEGDHVGAVDHHILGGTVVEVQNILDKFLLIASDGSGLLSLLYHGHDVVLRHLVFSVQQIQNGPPKHL